MHRRLKSERKLLEGIEANYEGVCEKLEFSFAGHGKRWGQKPPEPGSCEQHLVVGGSSRVLWRNMLSGRVLNWSKMLLASVNPVEKLIKPQRFL